MVSLFLYLQVVITLSGVGLVFKWMWYHWTHRRRLALARKLPLSLPPLPLIGHLHYFLQARNGIRVLETNELFKLLTAQTRSGVSCMWLGQVPYVVITRPDVLQRVVHISNSLMYKPAEVDVYKTFLGDGLITAPVHVWKQSRRQLNHVFHPRNVQLLVPEFNEESVRLVQSMSKLVGTGHQNILPHLTITSMVNVLKIMFGKDVLMDPESQHTKELIDNSVRLIDVISERFWTPWLWWDVTFRYLYGNLLGRTEYLWKGFLSTALNQENRKQMDENTEEDWNGELPKSSDESKQDLITVIDAFLNLQRLGPDFQEYYMRTECQTIASAGTDTTAVTLSSCLVALGIYPEIQERLYQEVVEVAGTSSRHVTLEDINKMTYMDQVLKETIRRFCVLPLTVRISAKDIELDDCCIPANTPLVALFASIHMNPDNFPDPFKYDPDRFSPENVANVKKNTYLPFSVGARECIGKHFAMIAMKINLTHILREFKIHSNVDMNEMRFKYRISFVSVDGYHVQLIRRTS